MSNITHHVTLSNWPALYICTYIPTTIVDTFHALKHWKGQHLEIGMQRYVRDPSENLAHIRLFI